MLVFFGLAAAFTAPLSPRTALHSAAWPRVRMTELPSEFTGGAVPTGSQPTVVNTDSAAAALSSTLAAERSVALCSAADAVVRACLGLDRGAAASVTDAKRVTDTIERFESMASPSESGEDLLARLEGEWRLVWSSALVDSGGMPTADELKRFVVTLVDAPTARSRLAIREVTQRIRGASMEERLSLRLRVAWPLPTPPELELTISSVLSAAVDDAEPTSSFSSSSTLVRTVESVGVSLGGTPAKGTLPAGKLREAVAKALPPLPPSVPWTRELEKLDEGVRTVDVTALGGGLRVTRSPLGELRVYAKSTSAGGGSGGGAAASDEEASGSAMVDAGALEEMTRPLRAAVEAAEQALAQSEARALAAASAAAAELEQAKELAQAQHAAAMAVAEAELAEACKEAEEQLQSHQSAAAAEREALTSLHANALQAAELKAAEERAAAQRALDLAMAKAEEEAAAQRAAHLEERQRLTQAVMVAEERAAKAKAAAQAVISDL